jgi:hypothetical protein
MEKWNILATAQKRQERYALRLLNKYGGFRGSGYRDVILGYVADVPAFLEALESIRRQAPGKLRSLGQIVPLEKNFQFDIADFRDKVREAVFPYIDQLEDSRFFVWVKVK